MRTIHQLRAAVKKVHPDAFCFGWNRWGHADGPKYQISVPCNLLGDVCKTRLAAWRSAVKRIEGRREK